MFSLSSCCFLNMALPQAWNVVTGHGMCKEVLILSRNSCTALLVKDTTRISEGFTSFLSTRYFTFAATVVVLPAPAPAITRQWSSSVSTTFL